MSPAHPITHGDICTEYTQVATLRSGASSAGKVFGRDASNCMAYVFVESGTTVTETGGVGAEEVRAEFDDIFFEKIAFDA